MSADHMLMRVESQAIWHVKDGTVEISLQSLEPPPRPEWVTEDQWYGGGGDRLVALIPVKKAAAQAPVGWTRTGVNPDGTGRYTLYTWNGTAWANPKPCDGNGKPI